MASAPSRILIAIGQGATPHPQVGEQVSSIEEWAAERGAPVQQWTDAEGPSLIDACRSLANAAVAEGQQAVVVCVGGPPGGQGLPELAAALREGPPLAVAGVCTDRPALAPVVALLGSPTVDFRGGTWDLPLLPPSRPWSVYHQAHHQMGGTNPGQMGGTNPGIRINPPFASWGTTLTALSTARSSKSPPIAFELVLLDVHGWELRDDSRRLGVFLSTRAIQPTFVWQWFFSFCLDLHPVQGLTIPLQDDSDYFVWDDGVKPWPERFSFRYASGTVQSAGGRHNVGYADYTRMLRVDLDAPRALAERYGHGPMAAVPLGEPQLMPGFSPRRYALSRPGRGNVGWMVREGDRHERTLRQPTIGLPGLPGLPGVAAQAHEAMRLSWFGQPSQLQGGLFSFAPGDTMVADSSQAVSVPSLAWRYRSVSSPG